MYLGGSGGSPVTIATVATGGAAALPFAGTGALIVIGLAVAFVAGGFLLLCHTKRRAARSL
ncbi:hypothetical protein GCM10025883_40870 [Mobilicoccus caccae]|uniref:LPXTG-motif cell wall anchor domain-containing protein n=1 Tax=Mobilicoccus caccae TaxID=1859295 RepID=A0ABQ6IVV8_9MICO|nr:hypothetical protein GCM10025883_40870 [Mobilicoccus caccae]